MAQVTHSQASVTHYGDSTGKGVLDSLSTMSLSVALLKYFVDHREDWKTFGKMNSHLYRDKLMKEMDRARLKPESRMVVFAMTSIIKSQPRILEAMANMPDTKKYVHDGVWQEVMNFFENYCCQYVSQAKKTKKFPVVNIPTCMPGLDMMWFAITSEGKERTLENACRRPTMSQIDLDDKMQDLAKEGYKYFWEKTVVGSKNPDKANLEAPKFNEDYYKTSAGDNYLLVYPDVKDGLKLKMWKKQSNASGYSEHDIMNYLAYFNQKNLEV